MCIRDRSKLVEAAVNKGDIDVLVMLAKRLVGYGGDLNNALSILYQDLTITTQSMLFNQTRNFTTNL